MERFLSLSVTRVNDYVNEFAGRRHQHDDGVPQRMAEISPRGWSAAASVGGFDG